MSRVPTCRDCGSPVLYVVTGVKRHDDGTFGPQRTAFNTDPVPTDTCKVLAVVHSRSRGWQDVALVHRPPGECLPVHRCPQYLERIVLDELEQTTPAGAVHAFMDRAPVRPGPPPSDGGQRVRRPA